MTISRADHIQSLEAAAGGARRGLPDDIFRFVSRLTPDLLEEQRVYARFF